MRLCELINFLKCIRITNLLTCIFLYLHLESCPGNISTPVSQSPIAYNLINYLIFILKFFLNKYRKRRENFNNCWDDKMRHKSFR